jgi:PHP family Zn ribbon phosphoesterase
VFETGSQSSDISYQHIYDAIKNSSKLRAESGKLKARIAYTIEFYPEEGKYHYTGHRMCNIRYTPEETKKKGTTCPVCGKPLTVGVMERVEKLAGRSEEELKLVTRDLEQGTSNSVKAYYSDAFPNRPPFVMLVPLQEILSECLGSPVASPKIQGPYTALVDAFGGEFTVLLKTPEKDIIKIAGDRVAAGIGKVRTGDLHIDPGYDGVFGVVKLWQEGEKKPLIDASKEQLTMF